VLVGEILDPVEIMFSVHGFRHLHAVGLASGNCSVEALVEALDAFTLIDLRRDQDRKSFVLSSRICGTHSLLDKLVSSST